MPSDLSSSVVESEYYDNETITNSNLDNFVFVKNTEFISCHFNEVDLCAKSLLGIKFIECTFTKCNLSNINVVGSTFREVTFKLSKVIGVNFSSCQGLSDLKGIDSNFDYCIFQNCKVPSVSFESCSLKESDFSEGQFVGGNFSNSNLEGALFNSSNISKCNFIGAKNYSIDLTVTKLKNAKFSMPEAISLFDPLEISIEF